MTFIVETGSVVSGANSYVSLTDADDYFLQMGSPAKWDAASNKEKEAALIYGTRWLDSNYTWYSWIYSTDQVLGWPRLPYLDEEGRTLGGALVPQVIKDVCCELALQHLTSNINISKTEGILSERLGDSSRTYSSGTASRSYSFIKTLLKRYGISNNTNRLYRN